MHCKQGRLLDNSHGLYRTPVLGQHWSTKEGKLVLSDCPDNPLAGIQESM